MKLRVLIVMGICLLLMGCNNTSAATLGDVYRMREVQRIYLLENGDQVPFLLLENRGGACLLLRERVIVGVPFAYEGSANSRYAGSALDEYLNGEYLLSLSDETQSCILPMNVVIYASSSIGTSGNSMETIQRSVFALSWTETTGIHGEKEGVFIPALKERTLLSALTDDGSEATWWLRTPDTWYWHTVMGINEEGGVCRLTTQDGYGICTSGARPAMYLSADTLVEPCDGGWRLNSNKTR